MSGREDTDVPAVGGRGAGQAGLSSAYHLDFEPERDFIALDHSPGPGGAWQFRWPSLTYDRVHGMHSLPGMELTDADPERPSTEVISEYFARYERTFGLRVRRPVDVRAVRERADGRLLVETSDGIWSTRVLSTRPLPGTARSGRAAAVGRPSAGASCTPRGTPGTGVFAGQRVVVVGAGPRGPAGTA